MVHRLRLNTTQRPGHTSRKALAKKKELRIDYKKWKSKDIGTKYFVLNSGPCAPCKLGGSRRTCGVNFSAQWVDNLFLCGFQIPHFKQGSQRKVRSSKFRLLNSDNVYIRNETLMQNHCMEIVGSLGLTMLDTMLSVED